MVGVREGEEPWLRDAVGLTECVPVLVMVCVGERVADDVIEGVPGASCLMRLLPMSSGGVWAGW